MINWGDESGLPFGTVIIIRLATMDAVLFFKKHLSSQQTNTRLGTDLFQELLRYVVASFEYKCL
jgi:hypothetical protein